MIPCVPIFRQHAKLWTCRPKFAQKNEFWGRNFKNLSLASESAPPTYLESQFSVKMDNSEFFGLNLGKLPNYVWYFGSNIVEGVAESWVEAEMSWVEVDGAGWRLKWAGWRWMELGGGGWSWVELGAWFSNALLKVVLHTRLNVYWESSGGSRFVTQSLGVIQMVTNKIYFMHQFDFPSKQLLSKCASTNSK